MWSLLLLAIGFLIGRLLRTPREAQHLLGSTIIVGEIPRSLRGRGQFCQGTYDCITGGSIYSPGDRTTIGFWQVENCPPNTTLGDGSSWRLRPGTCDCP